MPNYAEIKDREVAREAAMAALRADVAHLDTDPIVPGENFLGGNTFDGCYSGRVAAKNGTHVALHSPKAGRVAIVPVATALALEIGSVVAVARFGVRGIKWVRPIRADYDWLDAFDDFIFDLILTQRADTLTMAHVHRWMIPFNGDGSVAGWYRDLDADRRGVPA